MKRLETPVREFRVFSAALPALNENKLSYDYNAIWLLVRHIIYIYICARAHIRMHACTHAHTKGEATYKSQKSSHKHEQFTERLMLACYVYD
jgi:hypothetical protein